MREGSLAFDIADLLAFVGEEGNELAWRLFPMGWPKEIIGGDLPFDETTIWGIACQLDEAEDSVPLTWEQLRHYASAVRQTIWGTYLACRDANAFFGLKDLYLDNWAFLDRATEEYYQKVDIAFQAVDSSFWLVYVRDDALFCRIAQGFHTVETLRLR